MRAGRGVLGEQPFVLVSLMFRPPDSCQSSRPVCASSSMKMPALPPSMTTGRPFAVVSTGGFCRSSQTGRAG